MWPIVLVIILSIPFKVDLLISLLLTLALMMVTNRLDLRRTWNILRAGVPLKSLFVILSIMFFRQVLSSTGAVDQVPNALAMAGVSPPLILFFIPFLAGMLTGLSTGAVGVSFPVVMPLLITGSVDMGAVVLAYGAAFIGVLLSPVHLCLSLTRDYFKADWGPIYKMLLPSSAALTIIAAVLFVYL